MATPGIAEIYLVYEGQAGARHGASLPKDHGGTVAHSSRLYWIRAATKSVRFYDEVCCERDISCERRKAA
jgi:hypothetical protein